LAITNPWSGFKLQPSSPTPLYLQLAEIIAGQIQQGVLPAGAKLPPERDLALLFKVSRTTAINAYRHLERQGLVASKIGSGTYVASGTALHSDQNMAMPWDQLFVPHLKDPLASILRELVANPTADQTISLAAGMPDPALYPVDAFARLLARDFKNVDPADLGHIPTEGYRHLRQAIAEWDGRKGIPASFHNVLILAGSQQGLYLITRVFIEPGDYVILENPTYIGAIQAFQSAGARILSLPAAESYPLELLEDYLTRYRPKLFYTVSNFQNPSGRVTPLADRKEVLRLAAKYRMTILEDDPYSELYYDAPPPPSLKDRKSTRLNSSHT
jgi:DNA-binding transcriptional MocR family regulator